MALELAIDEDTIEARVGRRSLSLGEQYFRDGRLYATRRRGDVLKGRCRGQSGGPYRVEATLGAHGVKDAHCSCPVGGGGTCKHVAALLIGWQEAADAFAEVPEVEAALAQRTKEQLIALIKQMLRLEPDLETVLELPVPGGGGLDEPVDPEVFRAQAAAVFDREDHDWESVSAVVEGLLAIVEIGDEFVEQEEYAGAAAVFAGVAAEVGERSDPNWDPERELAGVVSRCVTGLGACLAGERKSDDVRSAVVGALFEIYEAESEWDGSAVADEALELLLKKTTPAERQLLAGRIRDAIADPESGWDEESAEEILFDLEAETFDDETVLNRYRETGRVLDAVERLLSRDRADEAVEEAARAGPYDLPEIADRLVEAGQGEAAEKLVASRMNKSPDPRLRHWLKSRAAARGDLVSVLDLAQTIFRDRPTLPGYQEIRELGRQLGQWESLRPALEEMLGDSRFQDLRGEIYLDEGEIDRAIELVKAAEAGSAKYPDYLSYNDLPIQVARAAEVSRPDEALRIYRTRVDQLIDHRGRDAYREASRLLLRMRAIQARRGEQKAFERYLQSVRDEHSRLRTLAEELSNAGL